MITINLYESSECLLVSETVPPEKEPEKQKYQLINIETQLQLMPSNSVRDNRPSIYIPAQTLFPII